MLGLLLGNQGASSVDELVCLANSQKVQNKELQSIRDSGQQRKAWGKEWINKNRSDASCREER